MKLKHILFSILVILVLACSSDSKEEGSSNEISNNSVATLSIEGMTCEIGCAAAIQEKLNETSGVEKAGVNFEKKMAVIHFDNTKISENEIEEMIEAMNDGQFEVEHKDATSSKNDSKVTSSGSDNEIDAHSFSFEVPNLFSVLKNIL